MARVPIFKRVQVPEQFREAFDAIPVLDALARSAEMGLPVDVER